MCEDERSGFLCKLQFWAYCSIEKQVLIKTKKTKVRASRRNNRRPTPPKQTALRSLHKRMELKKRLVFFSIPICNQCVYQGVPKKTKKNKSFVQMLQVCSIISTTYPQNFRALLCWEEVEVKFHFLQFCINFRKFSYFLLQIAC